MPAGRAAGRKVLRLGRRLLLFLVLAAAAGCSPERADAPLAYVGRDRCVACHPGESARYTGSDHDRAFDRATNTTVLGDFSGTALVEQGDTTRFAMRDGRYVVSTRGPDGTVQDFEVRYVIGVDPLQQYVVPIGRGRLQVLPWSWDTRPRNLGGQRWFNVQGAVPVAAGTRLHWLRPGRNWNRMCAECHVTDLRKNYEPERDAYATTWSEIDVSCEACHGPASGHLAWAEKGGGIDGNDRGFAMPLQRRAGNVRVRDAGEPSVPPVTPESSINETCARCHAHRAPIHPYRAGDRLADDYALTTLREPFYFADGQAREEVFVYGSFLQSRMHAAGIECTDCHDPHSGRPVADGDALCARCHAAARYATPDHHRHDPASAGARCVACHMPSRTFMEIDARRDHGFRVPDPARSAAVGAPDICADCHADRPAGWAAGSFEAWFPSRTNVPDETGFAPIFAAARRDPRPLVREIGDILRDPGRPAIVRATAAGLLRGLEDPAALAALESALRDPDPLVRSGAAAALESLDPGARWPLFRPLLSDPVRVVRMSAARMVAAIPASDVQAADREVLRDAIREYVDSELFNEDDAAASSRLGDFHADRGETAEAIRRYERAIRMDPGLPAAYANLADLYRSLNRDDLGRAVLERGLAENPDSPELEFSLGLLQIRTGEKEEGLMRIRRARGEEEARTATD